ncbi:MAG: hypothetical protein FD155_2880 [Bacteroidetes bacterium]|nr:MAG: hypothetical protein FD155_2880 [Bacteroidota bacterium]
MELIIILGLVLLNGIFSMAEMALVSSRKFKLESLRKRGRKGASSALELSSNPTRFLSTVQIGITLIGILLGVYSGENLTSDMERFLTSFSWIGEQAHSVAVGLIVLFVTYLSIVLGELLPKRIGMTYPETIAVTLSRPMVVISIITSPFVWLLEKSNTLLLKILGIRKNSDSVVTEEEIKSIIRESAEGGEIQDIESSIVSRVFELGDRRVNSLYTHRSDLVYFNVSENLDDIRKKIKLEKHSAYPVCNNNDLDDILGIVLLKDLFASTTDDTFLITDYLKQPVYMNESTYAYKVLELFKQKRMHYGIVVDEYGTTVGFVTMDDVLDALVGDMSEEDQDEYEIVQRDENSWLVDGQYPVIEFIKNFDISIPYESQGKFTTVAGLIIFNTGVMPNVGDRYIFGPYELEVIDKDGQRIDKIMVTRL